MSKWVAGAWHLIGVGGQRKLGKPAIGQNKMRTRNLSARLLAIAVLTNLLPAAVVLLDGWRMRPAAAQEMTDFKIGIWNRGGTHVPTLLPLWMGEDAGLFKKQGLNVQTVVMGARGPGAGDGPLPSVLTSGELQAMDVGLLPVVSVSTKGNDLRMIASSSNAFPFVMVASVKRGAELKGGKVDIGAAHTERILRLCSGLKSLA
jgi:ABC-type nitrate/sulfonate/bicarbonate transport system substrate-binding protein